MIRNDFVSNSSSSSYVISTKLNKQELIDYIAPKCGPKTEEFFGPNENRQYLEYTLLFNNYIPLLLGSYHYLDESILSLKYNYENYTLNGGCVEDISKYVKDGKVIITKDEFAKCVYPNHSKKVKYWQSLMEDIFVRHSWYTYEYTMDCIIFTKWFIENFCVDGFWKKIDQYLDHDKIKALKEQHKKDYTTEDIKSCFVSEEKYEELKTYIGKFAIYRKETVLKHLDYIENEIKNGRKVYNIIIGYSGEGGPDSSSWVWFEDDDWKKIDNDIIKSFSN